MGKYSKFFFLRIKISARQKPDWCPRLWPSSSFVLSYVMGIRRVLSAHSHYYGHRYNMLRYIISIYIFHCIIFFEIPQHSSKSLFHFNFTFQLISFFFSPQSRTRRKLNRILLNIPPLSLCRRRLFVSVSDIFVCSTEIFLFFFSRFHFWRRDSDFWRQRPFFTAGVILLWREDKNSAVSCGSAIKMFRSAHDCRALNLNRAGDFRSTADAVRDGEAADFLLGQRKKKRRESILNWKRKKRGAMAICLFVSRIYL